MKLSNYKKIAEKLKKKDAVMENQCTCSNCNCRSANNMVNLSKLYKEKFGKNAYVAEPGGTKEKTIDAIKECIEKNEDILDKLLYPNFEEDMNNGSLY